jgi:hypothetical protein
MSVFTYRQHIRAIAEDMVGKQVEELKKNNVTVSYDAVVDPLVTGETACFMYQSYQPFNDMIAYHGFTKWRDYVIKHSCYSHHLLNASDRLSADEVQTDGIRIDGRTVESYLIFHDLEDAVRHVVRGWIFMKDHFQVIHVGDSEVSA